MMKYIFYEYRNYQVCELEWKLDLKVGALEWKLDCQVWDLEWKVLVEY